MAVVVDIDVDVLVVVEKMVDIGVVDAVENRIIDIVIVVVVVVVAVHEVHVFDKHCSFDSQI